MPSDAVTIAVISAIGTGLVGLLTAVGVIVSAAIQRRTVREIAAEAEKARFDERLRDHQRREDDHRADMERLELEQRAAREDAEREAAAERDAEQRRAVTRFVSAADEALARAAPARAGSDLGNIVDSEAWSELTTAAADVIVYGGKNAVNARELIKEFRAAIASGGSSPRAHLNAARGQLDNMIDLLEQRH
jgi:hypothetical protein